MAAELLALAAVGSSRPRRAAPRAYRLSMAWTTTRQSQRFLQRGLYRRAAPPPRLRRRRDRDTTQLLLYADVENATSNARYRRLGFEPVEDRTTVRFGPRV
jgi:hypothetical protein